MSIYFNFDAGSHNTKFRRAIEQDKYEIQRMVCDEARGLFGRVTIGALIELLPLSICMIDEQHNVCGFLSLADYPNVPALDPAHWEIWMRNMFQKYYCSRNTLFIHYLCCIDTVSDTFLEDAFRSVFYNDCLLEYIILLLPYDYDNLNYLIFRYKCFTKLIQRIISAYKQMSADNRHNESKLYKMIVIERADFVPKLKIRRAVEEDNDDIAEILETKTTRLTKMYGDFYLSEIVGQRPPMSRRILVAQHNERAVGVMCLTSDIDFKNLQSIYALDSLNGLCKPGPMTKRSKRMTSFQEIVSKSIIEGTFTPFEAVVLPEEELEEKPHEVRSRTESVIWFPASPAISSVRFAARRQSMRPAENISEDSNTTEYDSDDSVLSFSKMFTSMILEDDPFDYEIVNINPDLLQVPDIEKLRQSIDDDAQSELQSQKETAPKPERKPKTTINKLKAVEVFDGIPNAFAIELYGIRDDFDERSAFDFLEASFEEMDRDFCIIRVPCDQKSFPLMHHFAYVPPKAEVSTQYSLYVTHRNSILGKFRVRNAEVADIPQIVAFLDTVDGSEILWVVEDNIRNQPVNHAYVIINETAIIGLAIMTATTPEQIHFIKTKYNLEKYHKNKYHVRYDGITAGFILLKTLILYPGFQSHLRFFARELMRVSGASAMLWMNTYGKTRWAVNEANAILATMVPLLPRKSEITCVNVPELKQVEDVSKVTTPLSIWYIDKKLTTLWKLHVDTRIFVVGASTTALSFINTLLFGETAPYLSFTNISLVSPNGFPHMGLRNALPEAWKMFFHSRYLKIRTMKCIPYSYYVDALHGTLIEINKKSKYIRLDSGNVYHYDMLFLLFGRQHQSPYIFKSVFEREENISSGRIPAYVPLGNPDNKHLEDMENEVLRVDVPINVFMINTVIDANNALQYIKRSFDKMAEGQVIVYGKSFHSYCCITALLESGVDPQRITFVEPFPARGKTRVSVFHNEYVDRSQLEVLAQYKIKTLRGYFFRAWNVQDNVAVDVEFISYFKLEFIPCLAFFYYGKKSVDLNGFVAINKAGLVVNGGIIIDSEFRAKDPHIYAAGPVARYQSRYYADDKTHKYFDSEEVGATLGQQIINQLDPICPVSLKSCMKTIKNKSISFEDHVSYKSFSNDCYLFQREGKSNLRKCEEDEEEDTRKSIKYLPKFKNPLVVHCFLPGNLQYLEVRAPGKSLQHRFLHTQDYTGFVLETYMHGYFKIHLDNQLFVDGITCLTVAKINLENFKNIYGLSEAVLNHLFIQYKTGRISNFYQYFKQPWAMVFYHDQKDDVLSTIKELLPKDRIPKETIVDALNNILKDVRITQTELIQCNANKLIENRAYYEEILAYLLNWVHENETTVPMFSTRHPPILGTYETMLKPMFQNDEIRSPEEIGLKKFI